VLQILPSTHAVLYVFVYIAHSLYGSWTISPEHGNTCAFLDRCSNTVGGGLVLPLADLGDLSGLEVGGTKPVAMVDGKNFNGAKAYKDSKVLNMMTVNELHRRYHKATGISFSSMYPGCIAEVSGTALVMEAGAKIRCMLSKSVDSVAALQACP
jgi:hypothetical protein